MVTVRELITRWGFDVDDAPIKRMDRQIKGLKRTTLAIGAVITATAGGITFLLNEAGKQEQTQIAFETLTGSVEKADKLIRELFAFAAKTPFTIPEVEKNTKLLLAYGTEVENIIPTLNALGNIASAVGPQAFGRLALALGQVRAKTRLMGQEMRQFTESGVDLLALLAKQTGKTIKEVQAMIPKGAVSFEMVEKALMDASKAGGRFYNLMLRQSKTLFGLISNLKDLVVIFSRELGAELLPAAKEIVIEFMDWFVLNRKLIKQNFIRYIKILVKFIKDVFIVLKLTTTILRGFVRLVGGAENAVKLLTFALAALLGLQLISFIGNSVLIVGQLIVAMTKLGRAALLTQAKIFLLPIAIGALITALALLAEDLIGFFKGKDSVTEQWVEAFKGMFSLLLNIAQRGLNKLGNFIKDWYDRTLLKKIIDFFQGGAIARGISRLAGFNIQQGASPSAVRSATTNNANNRFSVNAPINVNVPEGTNPERVGSMVKEGVSFGLERLLRDTFNANKPAFVQ